MSFFISDAYAQTAPQQPDMFTGLFLPMIFLAVIFYFLIIRPQSKRAKEHMIMLSELKKGDEVATNLMLGKVTRIGSNFVEIEVAENTIVRIQKQAVSNLMPKGTLKSTD